MWPQVGLTSPVDPYLGASDHHKHTHARPPISRCRKVETRGNTFRGKEREGRGKKRRRRRRRELKRQKLRVNTREEKFGEKYILVRKEGKKKE